ncbi:MULTISPECIES: phosphopantetheine-binding protein [Pseudoalteromonas]|uniref:acyl carrier protein n=1 Tax=Pseudoalteromonas TaxID=53246 RepID=UPI00029A34B8|nr:MULTISPECIES: phosphopantetheine-binding protein [Pseudoalteromonas]MBR8845630.1 acyl carrier protein [Pseudoalteromonas sp. JC3]NSY34800.1 acyl carrier protein [Pseudoalteromonas sp. JC28]QUI72624.1 acyl carrier protein [Pseudoalteromonas sp. M8]UDM60028.1 acyl carrier protein [Pseudoalteromonas piscicida]WJE08839.1 phosphopantetheine-binding protein [Pseudoalteromonas sp. JC3]
MNQTEIATIAANILYLDDVSEIEFDRSLFGDYSMSSLDYVDFAFELKGESGKEFDPDELWPINTMMDNPEYYQGGQWTEQGREELNKVFAGFTEVEGGNPSPESLYNLFSVNFIQHRINAL